MMTGEKEQTWKEHWHKKIIIKNVLGEIPILGPFFLEPRFLNALPKALHAAFMFFGGVILMSSDPANLMSMELKDNDLDKRVGVGTLYMMVGMWAGAVSYHAVDYGVRKLRFSLSSSEESPENQVSLLLQ